MHFYKFVVDGEKWINDPAQRQRAGSRRRASAEKTPAVLDRARHAKSFRRQSRITFTASIVLHDPKTSDLQRRRRPSCFACEFEHRRTTCRM